MARRRKEAAAVDPAEKARLKKLRAAQRRAERKLRRQKEGGETERSSTPKTYSGANPIVQDDHEWLRRDKTLAIAVKLLNDHKARPFWLSIPHEAGDGNPPVAGYYPCTMFRTKKRAYYGFMLREHRDTLYYLLEDARKELVDKVRKINPRIF